MHNMAEGGAVLGVTARTKDKMKRSEYLSIAIGCIVAGVTEPAIYGVNLKYKKPMYAVMAGGFAGSLVASLLGVRAYVMGYSNILSLPIFKETAMAAAVGILVSIAVAAVVAFVLNIDNEDSEKTTEPVKVEVADDAIVAVADGQLLALEAVADEVFSSKMMGDGVALSPESDFIVAPANGKLTTVFPTGHAFGLTRVDGVEILVHVGINTVELKGQGFDVLAKQGDLVRAGQPIVKIDREALVRKGYDITTIMVVTDSKGKHISLRHEGKIKSGTIL